MQIKKYKRFLSAAVVASLSVAAMGQTLVDISGRVTNENGDAVPGAAIMVEGQSTQTVTDNDGKYTLSIPESAKLKVSYIGYDDVVVDAKAPRSVYDFSLVPHCDDFIDKELKTGTTARDFRRAETTAAISVIQNKDVDHRSAKNIAWSTIGEGHGLISLDVNGTYFDANPVWYIRGLQSITTNAPLVLVDGIEREITALSPTEVEEVYILKDAAAVALYGYKAANGAVNIITKRGLYNQNQVTVSYDHAITFQVDRPEFVDGYTYALARNEALANEGQSAQFDQYQLEAIKNQDYPELFPDVDWVDETFKDTGSTNRYSIEFRGGGKKFRYYTGLTLLSDRGFIKNEDYSNYSTQDKYSRGTLRANLDIDLTEYTMLKINVGGVLSEMSRPGLNGNIWQYLYQIPSAAYPIFNSTKEWEHKANPVYGMWGGNETWDGSKNPVALTSVGGYYKIHERALYSDIELDQSLSMFVDGLGVFGRMGFDNYSTLYENYVASFAYGQVNAKFDSNGNLNFFNTSGDINSYSVTDEGNGVTGTDANTQAWDRDGVLQAGFYYDHAIGDFSKLFTQIKWDYEFTDYTGTNTTVYRQNFSWFGHYGIQNKYFVDWSLVGSESSRLAKDYKWAFSPTVAAAWVVSNEDFLANNDVVNFLKLRASFGKINADWLPGGTNVGGSSTYTSRLYAGGSQYLWDSTYQMGDYTGASRYPGRLPTENPTTEKAYKLNIGLDAKILGDIAIEFDYFHQKNKDAWVDGSNVYSSVIGLQAPYVNIGETTSSGVELALDYNKKVGNVAINVGGNILYSHCVVDEYGEETRAYENLVRTGKSLGGLFGLVAEGIFNTQAEIDAAPTQNLTTTRPGDIRYKDVNGDGVVDANDVCQIADNYQIPEVYYQFHLGAEWQGLGFNAIFQGVGRYSTTLSKTGYYRGLYNNMNIAQEVYEGSWKASAPDHNAKYPRLTSSTNDNNFQTSTLWLRDASFLKLRNVEIYYDFAQSLLSNTFFREAKIFARGTNLFTKFKDEDVNTCTDSSAPSTRQVSLGVSLGF